MLQWAEACGHSAFEFNPKACRWRTSGGAVKRSMKYGLEQEAGDVDLFEDTVITDLLTNDGKVCGAVGIRAYTCLLYTSINDAFHPFNINTI